MRVVEKQLTQFVRGRYWLLIHRALQSLAMARPGCGVASTCRADFPQVTLSGRIISATRNHELQAPFHSFGQRLHCGGKMLYPVLVSDTAILFQRPHAGPVRTNNLDNSLVRLGNQMTNSHQ